MSFIKFKPIASYFNFYNQLTESELAKNDLIFINDNENIKYAFKSSRDLVVFTDKRIILIDKKGFRAFRKTVTSINYEAISSYSMSIHNLDTTFEFILNSSHSMNMNFYKPIPLEVMYILYDFIATLLIKR